MSSSFSLKAHNVQSKRLLRIPEILQKFPSWHNFDQIYMKKYDNFKLI